jgi:ABC-type phosphate/phosphonate transport system substrate-binding protein
MGSTRKESTSSYILPKDYFDKNNLKVNSEFYSTEKALFAALARRKVSAIATWDWAVSNNNVKKIHILKTFEQIPNPPIVITHKMDPQKLTNIKNALVQIQIADKTQPTVGYANVAPNMYDALFSIYDSYCKNNLKECEW